MGELNIAIADDNPQTLGRLQEILEAETDFSVVGKAENGEDAYNMIVKTVPDVVLLDVIMPRMDGIAVMEKVRKNHTLKKTPAFIMVTAAGSENMTADAFRMGANYYVMKPFSKEIIVDKVRKVGRTKEKNKERAELRMVKPYMDKEEYMEQNLENDVTHMLHGIGIRPYLGVSVPAGRDYHVRGGSRDAFFRDQDPVSGHCQKAPDHGQPGGAGYPPCH